MSTGLDIPRVDGVAKLRGQTRYVDDLSVPGMLHGMTVRSPAARGRIKAVRFDRSIDWHQFTIVDYRDIPGKNEVQLIDHDQPVLVGSEFRHKYEPILLLAHALPAKLREAIAAIEIQYELLPAIFDFEQQPTPGVIQHATDNVFKRLRIQKGDVEAAMRNAAHIIEGVYHTGAQEHAYLETNGILVDHDERGLVVRGSMQCPFYVLKSLMHALALAEDQVRVIQTPTGGAFGGKEDYPSHLAIHAALLAQKARAPVKMIYDRQEDMAVTTKRHPARIRHRTAVDRDGHLRAMQVEVLMDGGAYVTLSPVVLSRGCIHAAGPYSCDNLDIHGEVRMTNSPPSGAFRGFGAPQTIFALERHLNVVADHLGIDPQELRRRNFVHDGQTLATGQVVKDRVDMSALMDRAMAVADFEKRQREHETFNRSHPYLRRGIGLATFMHGSGFTGSGETMLESQVWVARLPDGRVEVRVASTDMGQGTETVLRHIAAQRLRIPVDRVIFATPDTSRVSNSGPTVASRTVMVVGRLLEQACDDLLRQGEGSGSVGKATYTKPDSIQWDDSTYRGDAYAAFSWAAHVAEVEVDLRTFNARVTDYVAVQEVGRVVHPLLARGQIQGGVAQGIGWALMEQVVTRDGAMCNNQFTNYPIPTSSDVPTIRVFFEETPSEFGPGGAKGIGELPMDGPAPVIVNAIASAVAVADLNIVPLTPERLFEQMKNKGAL